MQSPLYFRKQIPFFYDKSEKEIQEDVYERFDPMVLRQSALHLADEAWGEYPFRPIMDFAEPFILEKESENIVEIGCSVGRWIAHVAEASNAVNCWGVDYSYQLLKRADECWLQGADLYLNLSRYGYSASHKIQGKKIKNLKFGLAKAESLPFADESQDIILNSFLLDRLSEVEEGVQEMFRILKPGGRVIFVTPLNFSRAKHWEQYYPPVKISQLFFAHGFKILDWREDFLLEEPLDFRKNKVQWNCIAGVLEKGF